jgi:adenylate kinase
MNDVNVPPVDPAVELLEARIATLYRRIDNLMVMRREANETRDRAVRKLERLAELEAAARELRALYATPIESETALVGDRMHRLLRAVDALGPAPGADGG